MKTLGAIKHAQIELFILITRLPHASLIDVYIRAVSTLWENETIVYMKICNTHLKLKNI